MEANYQSVAGVFYPKEEKEQKKLIRKFLEEVPLKKVEGDLKALIVPHAGWEYSGRVAASGFRVLQNYDDRSKLAISRVVLVGPAHQSFFKGVIKGVLDHSVEVEMPFIKYILPKAKIVPIVYGQISYKKLAQEILIELDKKSVLIFSSDLSHYCPYRLAKRIDERSCQLIEKLDLEGFMEEGDACGKLGICALLDLAKTFNWQGKLLECKNSADVTGLKDEVVGYASFAFSKG